MIGLLQQGILVLEPEHSFRHSIFLAIPHFLGNRLGYHEDYTVGFQVTSF
jgi:hypothetical protein